MIGVGPLDQNAVEVRVIESFARALTLVEDATLAALAVDMPIGLPDAEARIADRQARARLGPRHSTVFTTPARPALDAIDYPDALAISRLTTGRGLSKQAFHLLARIREVDGAITPAHQDRVFECHPELAFASLTGGPILASKHTPEGMAERTAHLDAVLPGVAPLIGNPPRGAKPDDVADALAIALVARRFCSGQATHLGDGARDRRGLRMEIVC